MPFLSTVAWVSVLSSVEPARGAECKDPLPIDPAVVTKEMQLEKFTGATQAGPVCHLSWQGGTGPSLLIYGPTGLAGLGQKFASPREAAEKYKGESPKGVEGIPGVSGGYMVFDPKTPNRRLFVQVGGKVYMIVSQEQIPLAVLSKAVLGT